MGFNKREEIGKEMLGFTFMMHEKNSSEARKIIHNSQKIPCTRKIRNFIWSPNITMK